MRFYFKITDPNGKNFRFKLQSGESITIGRDGPSAQLGIDDKLCSSKHCKIIARTNEVYVEDLKSKNGIFLNGVKVLRQKIYLDDVIKLGDSIIFVDSSKLGEAEKEALSYTGTHLRQKGSLTLELESEEDKPSNTRSAGRKSRSTKPKRGKKDKKRTTTSSSGKAKGFGHKVKTLIALLVDFFFTGFIFLISISSYKFIFPKEAAFLFKDGYHFSLIFHEAMSNHTLISLGIAIAFFYINRKFMKGSFGEKILRIS